ncbi:hypothetical protein A2380_02605 [candidate division WWE3 bacterium RIFOXYB1_FULL_43_24]|nr:MAG: hypothetical protein A2380_02605 [candidate division WWE3 bacterium RIFOXYB1_FULL_43_24]
MPTPQKRVLASTQNTEIPALAKRILFFSLVVALLAFPTLADDPCKNISDLDDKAACYAEQIEEKEDEYQSTSSKLSQIRETKNEITQKISGLLSQISVTQAEIDDLQNEITKIKKQLDEINAVLADRKTSLAEKISLRNKVVRTYSKRHLLNDIETFLVTNTSTGLNGFQFATLSQAFNTAVTDETIKIITGLNSEIDSYEKDKAEGEKLKGELEDTQKEFLAAKAELDARKNSAQGELSEVAQKESGYQNKLEDLEEEISELSEKQQSILKQKYGDEYGSVGDYEPPGSKTPDPPFKPAYAAFSYGAYTHYKGMSQYGAKGRADSGKSYEDIIKFYYKTGVDKVSGFPDKLCVEGQGDMDFQKYLYGIAEMPSDWHKEALKAQAIAARSYAYRYQKKGSCICTTQSCQVFLKSKSENPPSKWRDAVDDTKGIIVSDGVVTYYSSTTGGYIENVGWDTYGSWPGNAYEKKAGSPWFYKAWYTKSYSSNDTCGHSHPWLSEKEMADILNAYVVWSNGTGDEKDHISPVTTSCWGGDPYSLDEMASKADKYGKKYSKVTSVDVDISNGGYTSKVPLGTDNGTVTLNGDTFKTVFNLRAPGYVAIRSRLFDLEKRN